MVGYGIQNRMSLRQLSKQTATNQLQRVYPTISVNRKALNQRARIQNHRLSRAPWHRENPSFNETQTHRVCSISPNEARDQARAFLFLNFILVCLFGVGSF